MRLINESGFKSRAAYDGARTVYKNSLSDCAVTITQPFGVITSPGFPQVYRNGIDCTWNIQLSSGQLIHFFFLQFDVEDDYAYGCG